MMYTNVNNISNAIANIMFDVVTLSKLYEKVNEDMDVFTYYRKGSSVICYIEDSNGKRHIVEKFDLKVINEYDLAELIIRREFSRKFLFNVIFKAIFARIKLRSINGFIYGYAAKTKNHDIEFNYWYLETLFGKFLSALSNLEIFSALILLRIILDKLTYLAVLIVGERNNNFKEKREILMNSGVIDKELYEILGEIYDNLSRIIHGSVRSIGRRSVRLSGLLFDLEIICNSEHNVIDLLDKSICLVLSILDRITVFK